MPFPRRVPLWLSFVLVCVAAATLVALSLLSFYGYRRSADTTVQASSVILSESSVYISVLDAESSQRGYLLTGDEAFLESYAAARAKVESGLTTLDSRVRGDYEKAAMQRVRPAVEAKFAEMDQTIAVAEAGDREQATRIVESGEGARLTTTILDEMKSIAAVEAKRHNEARSSASTRSVQSLVAVSLLGVLVVGALLWIFRSLRRRGVEEGLRQLNREKDEFLGMVSHELRTPVTVVLGNANVLRRNWPTLAPADRATALADVEAEAQRMQGVVTNMLRLARPEQRLPAELEPILLGRLVAEAVQRHEARFPESRVLVREADRVAPVLGNDDYLIQVLENLLSNAVKYGAPNEAIEVVLSADATRARVEVMDRGPGIKGARKRHIFEPFVRLPGPGSDRDGLGLGLPICRMLMKAQDGDITVADRPGGGSIFSIVIPLAPDPETMAVMEVAADFNRG